jgi:hypothetical protein
MEQKAAPPPFPVIDKDKRMVGMLSMGDAAQAVSQSSAGELTRAVAEHH